MGITLNDIQRTYTTEGAPGVSCNAKECPFRPFLAHSAYSDPEDLGAFPGVKTTLNGAQIIQCCGAGILAAIRSCTGNSMGLFNHDALRNTEGFTGIANDPTGKALLKLTGLKLGLNAYYDFYYGAPLVPSTSTKVPGIPSIPDRLLQALGQSPEKASEQYIGRTLGEMLETAYAGCQRPSERYFQMGTALVALIDPALVKINAQRRIK